MKRFVPSNAVASLALGAICFAFACSSSSSSSGGTTDTGTPNDSGGDETTGDAPATLSCDDYCTKNLANCAGQLSQYKDSATCKTMCADFAVGLVKDTSGDTLGCRTYHTGAAASDATTHCPHSGPYGGKTCGDSRCANFCALALKHCAGVTGTPFTDSGTCMTVCGAANFDATKAELDQTPGSLNCMEYHLEASYGSAADAKTTHCPHLTTAAGSPCH